ncbi:MAG: hypothetical protein NTV94_04975 [Planctomycetota bacterium]|nr:hypothetical protein [Planctomycetota bacterium]
MLGEAGLQPHPLVKIQKLEATDQCAAAVTAPALKRSRHLKLSGIVVERDLFAFGDRPQRHKFASNKRSVWIAGVVQVTPLMTVRILALTFSPRMLDMEVLFHLNGIRRGTINQRLLDLQNHLADSDGLKCENAVEAVRQCDIDALANWGVNF